MALLELETDDVDDRLQARADSLAVAIAEDYGLTPEEAVEALARSLSVPRA